MYVVPGMLSSWTALLVSISYLHLAWKLTVHLSYHDIARREDSLFIQTLCVWSKLTTIIIWHQHMVNIHSCFLSSSLLLSVSSHPAAEDIEASAKAVKGQGREEPHAYRRHRIRCQDISVVAQSGRVGANPILAQRSQHVHSSHALFSAYSVSKGSNEYGSRNIKNCQLPPFLGTGFRGLLCFG